MVNEQDNADMFKEARCVGKNYFGHFKVILWSDHITVIGTGINQGYERIEIHKHISRWHHINGNERILRNEKSFVQEYNTAKME